MTREEMRNELFRLKKAREDAYRAESDARTAYGLFCKQIERELIEKGGWKTGDQITTKEGEKRWIARITFSEYNHRLIASCYRILKSGKRSANADVVVALVDLSMDKEPVA